MGPRFIASLSVLLAAAAGALLWLTAHTSDGSSAEPGKPTAPLTVASPKDVACPAGTPSGPSELPANPVVVRLCADPRSGAAPADALTTGAQDLVAAIAGLKKATTTTGCPHDDGDTYTLAFAYADGSKAYAVGHLSGCGLLTVGSTSYRDAHAALKAFATALWKQRDHKNPPAVHAPDTCPSDEPTSLIADAGRMTLARLCLVNGTHRGTPVTTSQVRTIVHDWAAGGAGHAMAPLSCGSTVDWRLYGVTDWGDPVALASVCGLFTDDNGHFWHPSAPTLSLLDHLKAKAS